MVNWSFVCLNELLILIIFLMKWINSMCVCTVCVQYKPLKVNQSKFFEYLYSILPKNNNAIWFKFGSKNVNVYFNSNWNQFLILPDLNIYFSYLISVSCACCQYFRRDDLCQNKNERKKLILCKLLSTHN